MTDEADYRRVLTDCRLEELARKIADNPHSRGALLVEWHHKLLENYGPSKANFAFLLFSIAMARPEMPNTVQINITGGNVANLNLGKQVGTINATIQAFANADDTHQELAKALKELTEAVMTDGKLSDGQKKEATEVLAGIAEQAQATPENRSLGTLKAMVAGFPTVIAAAEQVTKLWESWGPAIRTYFGF
ncbi:MAG: hypothetical protein ABSG52_14950 [Terriglobales bacterium]|jgi:hypothetical protein